MAEQLFKVNSFNKPDVITGNKEIAILIFRLIMMDPGDNPLFPEMGIGLKTNYAFISDEEIDDLKDNISRQISAYLPNYTGTEVAVALENKKLNIGVRLEDTIYQIDDALNQTADNIQLSNFISVN